MKFINEWKEKVKQEDKVNIEIRISSFTLIRIQGDWSEKSLRLTFCNLTFASKNLADKIKKGIQELSETINNATKEIENIVENKSKKVKARIKKAKTKIKKRRGK